MAQQAAAPAAAPAATPATPAATPAAAPAAAPAWKQGMAEGQASSPLHPFAPHMTGRAASELPIDKLKVPAGFKVEVWAEGVPEARSLALGDKGTLYVAERHRITRYDNIESQLDSPPQAVVVVDNLDPHKQPGHFWKYLAMGPDGKLYFNIGSPQNITMPTYMEAAIMRVDPKTGVLENYAQGVRNSVGMAFHPKTKQLWFTEHARDWIGDDMPSDELNVATKKGEHFGFPYCFQDDFLDPQYGKNRSCDDFTRPKLNLGAHVAPLGMRFYTGKMFPASYTNNVFIAQHGSWNRTTKQGYNVVRVTMDGKGNAKSEPFLEGFMTDEKADPPMWGRPADVLQMADGSLLVSDDYNGIIYRVSYKK
jgi:glucose/arabinose dehydrogenase